MGFGVEPKDRRGKKTNLPEHACERAVVLVERVRRQLARERAEDALEDGP
jgi:hypothetical protein